MRRVRLTAILERDGDGDGYVALCPEVDVASQGRTWDEARTNLKEAVELFFESAGDAEIAGRLPSEVRVESLEVTVG
jgi:predicted RNase H-like HicB family nuclease